MYIRIANTLYDAFLFAFRIQILRQRELRAKENLPHLQIQGKANKLQEERKEGYQEASLRKEVLEKESQVQY